MLASSGPHSRSAFVPHDLTAPIAGAASGPLAGLTVAVKDMYDIAGYRTGGGSPDWLAQQSPAKTTCPVVRKLLDAGATSDRQDRLRRILLQRRRRQRALRHAAQSARARAAARRLVERIGFGHRVRSSAILRSAAIPAVRCACRPRFAGFTASVPPMAGSTSRARCRWRTPSMSPAGSRTARGFSAKSGAVLLDGTRDRRGNQTRNRARRCFRARLIRMLRRC